MACGNLVNWPKDDLIMTKDTKDGFFYDTRDVLTRNAARKVLSLLRSHMGKFDSVVDIGCGVGTWLSVAEEISATRIQGFEASWVEDEASFVVPRHKIRIQNLEDKLDLKESFDLGICLEVAEHLSENAGENLVQTMSEHCSSILFSAAIPGQGGVGHINEQWPAYWQDRFARFGFEVVDFIRPLIWNDTSLPWWYRQNIVYFCKSEAASRYYEKLKSDVSLRNNPLPNLVCRPLDQAHCTQQIKHRRLDPIRRILKRLS